MMPHSMFILVRVIHIVVAVCWVGAVVFISDFLLPTMKAVGPAAGPVMGHLTQVKKLPAVLMSGAVVTVLSGVTLFWYDSVGFKSDMWMHSATGLAFSVGGTIGIIVAILAIMVNSPTARKLGALGAAVHASGGAPSAAQTAEMERLQHRLASAMKLAARLLILAACAMAIARYLPF